MSTRSDREARTEKLFERALELPAAERDANALRFDPDGSLAAGNDGTVRVWEVDSGRPRWRAPVLMGSPPEVLTHRGWRRLDGPGSEPAAGSAWRRAVERQGRLGAAGHRLYAATELGDVEVLDLGVYYRDHCGLLREVWREVPVIWENGLAVPREPAASHACGFLLQSISGSPNPEGLAQEAGRQGR